MSKVDLSTEPAVERVTFTSAEMVVERVGGNRFTIPLDWYPVLRDAPSEDRDTFEIAWNGHILRWPRLALQFFVPILARSKGPLVEADWDKAFEDEPKK